MQRHDATGTQSRPKLCESDMMAEGIEQTFKLWNQNHCSSHPVSRWFARVDRWPHCKIGKIYMITNHWLACACFQQNAVKIVFFSNWLGTKNQQKWFSTPKKLITSISSFKTSKTFAPSSKSNSWGRMFSYPRNPDPSSKKNSRPPMCSTPPPKKKYSITSACNTFYHVFLNMSKKKGEKSPFFVEGTTSITLAKLQPQRLSATSSGSKSQAL